MSVLVEGRHRAAETAHAERAWLAWHTASLHRAKKMPPLKALTTPPKRKRPRVPPSADRLLTIARMWASVSSPEETPA